MLKNSTPDAPQPFSQQAGQKVWPLASAKTALAELLKTLKHQIENGAFTRTEDSLLRLEIPIEKTPLMAWLHNQDDDRKTYWADREHAMETAGIGEAFTLTPDNGGSCDIIFKVLRRHLSHNFPRLKFYGGFRFYDQRSEYDTWDDFKTCRFVVPQWELTKIEGITWFACNLKNPLYHQGENDIDAALKQLEQIDFSAAGIDDCRSHILSRVDIPSKDAWGQKIENALKLISEGAMEKIVLARQSTFSFEQPINPLYLLDRLKGSKANLFYFCFQLDKQRAFFGGSPERLYHKENSMIKSEAIAGTRPRGITAAEDKILAAQLMHCEKDIREHRFVLNTIREKLENLCHTVDTDDHLTVIQLTKVQHLRCRLQGILKSDVTDADILKALHPTPAVGGTPTHIAVEKIRELEPFDRGWYAAPVGWVAKDESEFVVGIRSGLINGTQLNLFSGAGIVEGSKAESEWMEIENKIANFMRAFIA